MIDSPAELFGALLTTSVSALVGFLLSTVAGIAIAVFLSSSRAIQRAFYPYAVFFQTVPIIAIAPLLVIWFGYGTRTVIASAFVVSIFPVIANTLSGILSTEPALRDLFRLYGASTLVTLFKLRFPAALPQILTGLRVASGLAVIGAIVGEFIGGQGLGSVVDVARTQQRVDKVFAAVLLASVLGLALFGLDQSGELRHPAALARERTIAATRRPRRPHVADTIIRRNDKERGIGRRAIHVLYSGCHLTVRPRMFHQAEQTKLLRSPTLVHRNQRRLFVGRRSRAGTLEFDSLNGLCAEILSLLRLLA